MRLTLLNLGKLIRDILHLLPTEMHIIVIDDEIDIYF